MNFRLARPLAALAISSAAFAAHAATLSAGFDHNLAIVAGQVWSWGGNAGGKLGNGSTNNSAIPVRAGTLTGVVSVATGMTESFAVKSDGTLWAWGLNNNGQLGIGASSPNTCDVKVQSGGTYGCAKVPVQVTGITGVTDVAAGWGQVIARKSDGTVWTWGSTQGGALGRTGTTNVPGQVPLLTGVTKVAAGYFHSVALKSDGTVVTWGNDSFGELGDDPNGPGTVRTVTGLTGVVDISARGGFTLALKSDGSVVMWGQGRYGQRGNGLAPVDVTPSPLTVFPGASGVVEIAAGWAHALVRKSDNTVWAWGHNAAGQIGPTSPNVSPNGCGSSLNRPCARAPFQIATGASAIYGGGAHSIIVETNGDILVFGDNDSGQHGDESGNFGGSATFSSTTYDPEFTLTPLGAFGSGSSVGTGSTAGDLNLGNLNSGVYFPAGLVGSPTSSSPVSVANVSSFEPFDITAISTSGAFSRTHNCPATLNASSSCQINITFTAASTGTHQGTLTINTNIPDSPTMTVAITGNGVNVPSEPTAVSATAGSGQATVSFSPPSSDGGSPINNYTATSNPDNISVAGSESPIVVGGLTNGTAYTFTVRASNAYGMGAASLPSTAVTPKATTTTAVTSNNNPAASGSSVTLTATITASSGTATGTVAFKDGGTTIGGCSAQTVSAGAAQCTTSALSPGVHSITADYPGAAAFFGSLSAPFTQTVNNPDYTVTVTKSGAGTGAVVSAPAGINCGATCAAPFASGTGVTLTATADAGFVFLRWSGCDVPSANQCALTVNAPRTVSASFGYAEVGRRDLNADGYADLLWRNSSDGSVQGWLMNGLSATQIAGLLPAGGYTVTHVADLDGDGKVDLLIRNTDGTVIGWLMNGLGVTAQTTFVGAGSGWSIVKAADLNGDGKADLIWQHTDGTVQAWLMNGLSVASVATFVGAGSGWSVSQIVDLDGDGRSDIVWQHSTGTVQAWLMSGLGVTSIASYAPAGSGWSVVLGGDFNGDGKADLFWQHTDGSSQAWLMNGLAVAQVASFTPAGTGWGLALAGDLDGDGKADIFWQHSSGASQTWMMNGLTVSNLASFVPGGTGWTASHLTDLNGDGKKDVLWKHSTGAVQAWLMNGLTITQIGSLAGAGSYLVIP